MKKFEYVQINRILTDEELNDYGKEGWELVTKNIYVFGGERRFEYTFKKEINE